ncbi:MAG: hypothetical protein SV765_17540 [Pseudomonadota bacterium]|nr:hypothetical protein [Pseudomonadota bacterium]
MNYYSKVRANPGKFQRQRAQILPLSLAVLVIAAVTFFVVFNSGRVVNEKINLVNAADAAAFSGAQVAARHLNFMAYTNRAMIANEVAIGHLYSFQVEAEIIGNSLTQVLTGGGMLGDFIRFLVCDIDIPFVTVDCAQLEAWAIQYMEQIIQGSGAYTGILSLMLDANNTRFGEFQAQAYQDLLTLDNRNRTLVDRTMEVVAASYIDRPYAPISVNDPQVLADFVASDNERASDAATLASTNTLELCEMILFATPGAEVGNGVGSANAGRRQECEQRLSGNDPNDNLLGGLDNPEADGGMMLQAIRATVEHTENATFIRDRNMNYIAGGFLPVQRRGSTEVVYDNSTQSLNWEAGDDRLTMPVFGTVTASGDARSNTQQGLSWLDQGFDYILQLSGLCNEEDVSCEDVVNGAYDSIQRYAALDPNRQTAVITAFVDQNNCGDGIGYNDDGSRKQGWSNNLQRFEDEGDTFCGETIYAIGQAEVYFQRPDCLPNALGICTGGFAAPSADGSREVANLYNPFWHARLVVR